MLVKFDVEKEIYDINPGRNLWLVHENGEAEFIFIKEINDSRITVVSASEVPLSNLINRKVSEDIQRLPDRDILLSNQKGFYIFPETIKAFYSKKAMIAYRKNE